LINYYKQGSVGPYEPGGEPIWSVVLGDLYGLSLYIPAFALWWGTGSYKFFLIIFTGTFIMTFFTTLNAIYKTVRFAYRKMRRAKKPAIVWVE
jgi:hypothetical protein